MYYGLMLIVALVKYDQVIYTQTYKINLDFVLYSYVNGAYCEIQPGYVQTHTINLDYVLWAYAISYFCKM